MTQPLLNLIVPKLQMEVAVEPRVYAVYDFFVSFLPCPLYWVKFGKEPASLKRTDGTENALGGEIAKIAGLSVVLCEEGAQ